MAKLVVTYEDGEIKKELTFRGDIFILTMPPWENGLRTSKEKTFEYQLRDRYPEDVFIDEIMNAAFQLDLSDEDDIEESLERLFEFEA